MLFQSWCLQFFYFSVTVNHIFKSYFAISVKVNLNNTGSKHHVLELQGRVVTEGGEGNFTCLTFLVVTMQKLLKSVYIYGSYRKIKTGISFFGALCMLLQFTSKKLSTTNAQYTHENRLLPLATTATVEV